jgi:type I restriction enzyme S subunit
MLAEVETQLPDGWMAAKIADFTSKVGSGATPRGGSENYKTSGTPLIRSQNVHFDGFSDEGLAFLDDKQAAALDDVTVQAHDVLLNITGASIGRVTTAPDKMAGARVNQHVFIIRPIPGILPQFIAGYLSSPAVQMHIMSAEYGVTRQALTKGQILNFEIPLPPLAEQKRIVAKVVELQAGVNAARARLANAPALLKRFRQSVLAAACSGQLTADWRERHHAESAKDLVRRLRLMCPTNAELDAEFPVKRWRVENARSPQMDQLPDIPPTWTWVHLPEIGYMNRGRSRNRPRNAPNLYGGNYPFIQTGDIAQSRGRIRQHKQTYSEAGLAQSSMWPADTICITIAANIADSAMLTYPACFPDSVVGLIPDPELCVAAFAEFIIRTARENLSQFAPATAQKNINIGILEEVAVPLPPLAEQHEIVRRVEALFALADKIEARVQAATARVENITQSILAKAFRGELVPTEAALARTENRPYEPASTLLARLRTQREGAEDGRATRTPGRRQRRNAP